MRKPARYLALSALSAALLAAVFLAYCSCSPLARASRLEAMVKAHLADAHHANLTIIEWGPHRIGQGKTVLCWGEVVLAEYTDVLRVRYLVDGRERDELFYVGGGAVQWHAPNLKGAGWRER